MALLLGCDVYCKGMKGIGAERLSHLINEQYPEFYWTHQPNTNDPITLYGFLHRHLVRNTPGFDTSVVQTYIRALVYEPTNLKVRCVYLLCSNIISHYVTQEINNQFAS